MSDVCILHLMAKYDFDSTIIWNEYDLLTLKENFVVINFWNI